MYRKRTSYDWTLEILSLLCLIVTLYPLLFYSDISREVLIPIHYNMYGEADGWGGRHFLLVTPLISVGLYFLLSILERSSSKINFPFKVNSKNVDIFYRLRVRMLRHLKLFSMLIFAYMNISSYFIATGKGYGELNKYIMIVLLAGVLVTVILYYFKMMAYKD